MTLGSSKDGSRDPLLIYGPVDDAATLMNPNEAILCLIKTGIEPSPVSLRFAAQRTKADAPRTFQVPKSDVDDDLSVAFLPGAELSSLIDDAMEPEDHDTEEEETSEESDLPQGKGPLPLGELALALVDPDIATEIAELDGFRSYYDQVERITKLMPRRNTQGTYLLHQS
jgi:hypothetical protein